MLDRSGGHCFSVGSGSHSRSDPVHRTPNKKTDALSCLYEPELATKEPESIFTTEVCGRRGFLANRKICAG